MNPELVIADEPTSSLDADRLRIAFVVYGGTSRRDWRTVRIEDVEARPEEIRGHLEEAAGISR